MTPYKRPFLLLFNISTLEALKRQLLFTQERIKRGGGDKASMIALAREVINRGGALDPVWVAAPEEEPRHSCESLAVSCTNRK